MKRRLYDNLVVIFKDNSDLGKKNILIYEYGLSSDFSSRMDAFTFSMLLR